MGYVQISPMPQKYRGIPKRLRPVHPPIFVDYGPNEVRTEEDIKLAKELFELLDEESKEWYRKYGSLFKDL